MEKDQLTGPLKKMDNNLSEIFDTEPIELLPSQPAGPVVVQDETDEASQVDADSSFVRSNMYVLVQQGNDALSYALELARQSDSPRAFEVVSTLLSTLANMNMQLMDAHEKKNKLKKPTIDQPQKVVNNSIVFQGTTGDLKKMLQDMRQENDD